MDSRSDIETTLYAMVHHSVGNLVGNQMNLPPFGQLNQIRPNFQMGSMFQNSRASIHINQPRNMGESRYWRHTTSTNSNFEFSRNFHNQRAAVGFNQRMMTGPSIPSVNRPRIFNSYTPYLSYSNNNNGQYNGRRFTNPPQNRNGGNFNNRNHQNNRNNPNLSKEKRTGKYVANNKYRVEMQKKVYSNNIELPSIKTVAANIIPKETVILSSSDDDDEAVIVVPVPSPPMVCIDDSDNEKERNLFATPNVPSCSGMNRNKTCRPCSPTSSVVSDDFIIQNDRSRIITENINITEDDELQCQQPTVGSLLNNSIVNSPTNNLGTIKKASLSGPQSKDENCVVPKKCRNYQITDINDNEGRIKKFRKRKSSGSNKTSEYASSNDEENDQMEHNSIINRDKTSTPYIVRGSAVECHVKSGKLGIPRIKHTPKRQKFNSINQSDDDFISTLSNICYSENEKDDTPPEITAKELIANVDRSIDQRIKSIRKVGCVEADSTPMEQDIDDNTNESIPNAVNDENIITIEDDTKQDDSVDNMNKLNSSVSKRKKISLVDEYNDDEIGWNTEMRNFYNESWGGENFDLTEVQSKMKGSPSLWRIRSDDKFPVEKYGKNSKMRCLNCTEFGHVRARCPQPRKKPICRMCGSQQHTEPRCTNKICLKCGSPNIVFSAACKKCRFQTNSRCGICRQTGHITQYCPDSWRRYHSTTSDHTPLQNMVEYSKVKYCPACGEKGHWAESCDNAVRYLDAPAATSRIITHTPSYPINKNALKNNLSTKNLLQASLIKESQGEVMVKLEKYCSLDKKTFFGRFVNEMEKQVNNKKMNRKIKKKNNMLLNPFSKFPKPPLVGNKSNIENFSFSEEMKKLQNNTSNTPQTETSISFKLDFITSNKSSENVTPASAFSDKPVVVVAEEKSDSNYSFSEFYDKSKVQNNEPPNEITQEIQENATIINEPPKKVGRNDHMVEQDYISLTVNDDVENITENSPRSSDQFNVVLNDSEETSISDQKCTAKIYLTKQDSELILSSSGQKIISSLCSKYNVIAKMEFQLRGYVLNITGLPSQQNLFHTDFVNHIQESRKEQKRKQLEQSLQVPKHKKPLIKYIDNLFSMLKINLGDVNQVYRKMTYNETLNSRNGQKMADRSRRILNMILFGQTGLREGKEHLDALNNISTQLKCENEDIPITNEFRNELFRHVKYIFTPFEHPNYNEAIKDYYNLKYISSEEVNKNEAHLKPNPLAIANQIVESSISTAKQATIEHPENTIASEDWSLKCKDLVDECRSLLESDECSAKIISKLDRVYDKALKRELNYLDYQALQKIMGKIQQKSKLLI